MQMTTRYMCLQLTLVRPKLSYLGLYHLKLNEGKTEILLMTGILRTNIADDYGTVNMGPSLHSPFEAARNFGVYIDLQRSLRKHIFMVAKNSHFHLCNIYVIKKYLDPKCVQSLPGVW